MAGLRRIGQSTIGFESESGSNEFLRTVFIPEVDPRHDRFTSIAAALGVQGLFVQYDRRSLPEALEALDAIFRETRDWALRQTSRIAYALMDSSTQAALTLGRTEAWRQSASARWHLPHLAGLRLTSRAGDQIQRNPQHANWVQFGRFRFSRGSFRTDCTPSLDLVSGQFQFRFTADESFFKTIDVGQPFTGAAGVESIPGDRYISSRAMTVSVFDTSAIGRISQPMEVELDLFKHWNEESGNSLADIYLKRTKFRFLAQRSARKIPFNARDTLGRQLTAQLGRDDQSLRILPAPRELRHEISDPREMHLLRNATVFIPHGLFHVESSASQGMEIDRRFKLGPSNTEMFEIREAGGRANLGIRFTSNIANAGFSSSGGRPTGGFLRRSLAASARAEGTDDSIVNDLEKGDALTSDVDSVWPEFVFLNENGDEVSRRSFGARSGSKPVYSVQPDAIVRYAPDSKNAIDGKGARIPAEQCGNAGRPDALYVFGWNPVSTAGTTIPADGPGTLSEPTPLCGSKGGGASTIDADARATRPFRRSTNQRHAARI